MQGFEIRSDLFSPNAEGDLEFANGKPGSKLGQWLYTKLSEKGYQCKELLQEDYGWGFWVIEKGLDIWVDIGLVDAGEDYQENEQDQAKPKSTVKSSNVLQKMGYLCKARGQF